LFHIKWQESRIEAAPLLFFSAIQHLQISINMFLLDLCGHGGSVWRMEIKRMKNRIL
jgi:hypothetical protein